MSGGRIDYTGGHPSPQHRSISRSIVASERRRRAGRFKLSICPACSRQQCGVQLRLRGQTTTGLSRYH
jgi:hypothetical protein